MAQYAKTSPYYTTGQGTETLGILSKRLFAFEADDILYEIDSFYEITAGTQIRIPKKTTLETYLGI